MPLYAKVVSGVTQPLKLDENYKPSTRQALASTWDTAIATNPTQSAENLLLGIPDFSEMSDSDVVEFADAYRENPPQKMPVEEQRQYIRDSGVEGMIAPHEDYTRDVVDTLIDAKRKENLRNFVYDQSSAGQALLGFAVAGLPASMIDPLNLASSFAPVPGLGAKSMISLMQAHSKSLGARTLIRAGEGAASGAIGAAAVEPFVYTGQQKIQADYTMYNSVMNLGMGALMGSALKPLAGAVGERLRSMRNQPQTWEYAPRTEESEAYRQTHENAMFKAQREANPDLDPDSLLSSVRDNVAIYDAWMRHLAYKQQLPISDLYNHYRIDYLSGEIFDARVAQAGELVENYQALSEKVAQAENLAQMREQTPELRIPDDGFDLVAAKAKLEAMGKQLPEAMDLLHKQSVLRLAESVEENSLSQSRLAGEKLAGEVEQWGKTVDKVYASGSLPGNEVRMLSQTPLIMKLLDTDPQAPGVSAQGGIYASPHLFDKKHLSIAANELKQIPAALADPIAILDSSTRKGDLVFMTPIKDINGSTIVVPVELRSRQTSKKGRLANRAKSAYAKDYELTLADSAGAVILPNDRWFINQLKQNARYINGQKLEDWMRTRGSNSQDQLFSGASNASGHKVFTDSDLVNIRSKNPGLYQSPNFSPPSRSNAVGGNNTTVYGVGGTVRDGARYEVWELSDIIPSHDPKNQFMRRKDYPATAQERPYHSDPGEQGKVLSNARTYQPELVVNTNPTAVEGPPIITKNGLVLGGNSRAMTIDLVYSQNPEKAALYRQTIADNAAHFGLDSRAVSSMRQPVLVRVLDADLDESAMQLKTREYNQTNTQKLQSEAEAISRGKFFSSETLAKIHEGVEAEGTLNYYLSTRDTIPLAEMLIKDGVMQQTEYSAMTLPNGQLNSQGKALVVSALRGLVAPDYDVISMLPAKISEKLDLSIAAAVALKNAGSEWDLSGAIVKALGLINEASSLGRNLESWLGQASMVPHIKDNPVLQTLAMLFKNADAREIKTRMEIFANESANAGPSLLGKAAQSNPQDAFKKAFLKPAASVDGVNISEYSPDKNPLSAAIAWAKKHGGKKGTAKEALEAIAKKVMDKKLSVEEKALLKQHESELVNFVGKINVYNPKIGKLFNPDALGDLDIPAANRLEPESAPAPDQAIPQPAPTRPDASQVAQPYKFQPETWETNRAAVTFLSEHQAMVRFFRSSDLTSAPHEMYHIIQRQLEQEALGPNANPDIASMYASACEFVGAKPGGRWTRAQHEKFARAGERYLWEGIAPNAQMQPVLERMKERFLEVYADADAAGLEISPGMRKVFDDMLTVPIGEGEMRIQREIAQLNAREWEKKFYNPANAREAADSLHAADLGVDLETARNIIDAEQGEIDRAVNTLMQSQIREYAEIGQEFRAMLDAENANIDKVQRHGRILEELVACQSMRG